jgi:hypothetical protein
MQTTWALPNLHGAGPPELRGLSTPPMFLLMVICGLSRMYVGVCANEMGLTKGPDRAIHVGIFLLGPVSGCAFSLWARVELSYFEVRSSEQKEGNQFSAEFLWIVKAKPTWFGFAPSRNPTVLVELTM